MPDALTLDQARRVALAAQGLAAPARPALGRAGHPARHPGTARRHPDRLHQRGRPQPRAGPGRPGRRPRPGRLRPGRHRRRAGFEYWGHAASFLPMASFGCACPGCAGWPPPPGAGGPTSAGATSTSTAGAGPHPPRARWPPPPSATPTGRPGELVGLGAGQARARGPVRPGDGAGPRPGQLRAPLRPGRAGRAARDRPPSRPRPRPPALTLLAARYLGVGNAADLADYRLRPAEARALAETVAAGLLQEVAVEGWARPAYLSPGRRVPRRVAHRRCCSARSTR